jgi:hypothetical protein
MTKATHRRVYTFAHTFAVAQASAKRAAEAGGADALYPSMNAILYSAFTLEAFINHLGATGIPFWQIIERPLRVREKLDVLCSVLKITPDFGVPPFQSLTEAFRLRDLIAHGRTEDLSLSAPHKFGTMEELRVPLTQWESLCSPERAARIVADTRSILNRLHAAANLGPTAPLALLSANV